MHWRKVAIMGVGLLGGSLGLALKKRALAEQVRGLVRRPAAAEACRQAGAVDLAAMDPVEAVRDADLVVLCTPIAGMPDLVESCLPGLKPGVLVTDVGSAKGMVAERLEPILARAGAHFIGSHPMAGSEKTGVASARADLFESAVCVVTPTDRSEEARIEAVEGLWRSVGGRTIRMAPDWHDALASRGSHLPHLVAAQLAHGVLDPARGLEQARLCASGFRDSTRIASGSVEMWRDICLANRAHLSMALAEFIAGLERLRGALERGDDRAVTVFLEEAKTRRDRWRENGGASSEE